MDILVDGVIFGLQKAGGISRVWAQLLQQLDSSDFSSGILVPTNQNIEWIDLVPKLKNTKIIKRRRFRWGKTSKLVDSIYLSSVAASFSPRIWHSSYYVGMPYNKAHRILSYHDMIPEKIDEVNAYEQKRKYQALARSTTILAPSLSAKNDLVSYWPEFNKVEVIPHGLSLNIPTQEKSTEPFFLFVGKRTGYKDFLPTVQEILDDPRFNNYSIKVIGGEEQQELQHRRIDYLGTLCFPEVLHWIQKAHVLLFPSHYEGFGLPVLEAFSLGTPVLARSNSSILEITGLDYPLITDTTCGNTLCQLLTEKDKWISFGKKRASLFSEERSWKGYQKIYEKIMNSSQ